MSDDIDVEIVTEPDDGYDYDEDYAYEHRHDVIEYSDGDIAIVLGFYGAIILCIVGAVTVSHLIDKINRSENKKEFISNMKAMLTVSSKNNSFAALSNYNFIRDLKDFDTDLARLLNGYSQCKYMCDKAQRLLFSKSSYCTSLEAESLTLLERNADRLGRLYYNLLLFSILYVEDKTDANKVMVANQVMKVQKFLNNFDL